MILFFICFTVRIVYYQQFEFYKLVGLFLFCDKVYHRKVNANTCDSLPRYWLDLSPEDIHWNISDTGWAKSAYSSFFGPWMQGSCVFVYHRERFDSLAILNTLQKYPISTFCSAPTAYRMMIQEDLASYKFSKLRHCVSAGEPLNPEVIDEWREATGLQIREGYGQSETVSKVGNRTRMSYFGKRTHERLN